MLLLVGSVRLLMVMLRLQRDLLRREIDLVVEQVTTL